ncbi:hypothetical protein L6452_37169 [Arctium lappa]|uniref:Uncharacterized protein n=1 Tax=Arctium lappa TaxID=4217 RepID=A0ACB8Y2Y0_ARCLA|nr:hypothetical protein L6452_37169 [Arctium lappa]
MAHFFVRLPIKTRYRESRKSDHQNKDNTGVVVIQGWSVDGLRCWWLTAVLSRRIVPRRCFTVATRVEIDDEVVARNYSSGVGTANRRVFTSRCGQRFTALARARVVKLCMEVVGAVDGGTDTSSVTVAVGSGLVSIVSGGGGTEAPRFSDCCGVDGTEGCFSMDSEQGGKWTGQQLGAVLREEMGHQ